jgi:prepilin-type N-terminal cleavage/methylation domain-containing protein
MGLHLDTRARAERGFTLIELMVVVAVIAILAAVVVPTFMREGNKVKALSEVTPMFAALSTKQEEYKQENGVYKTAAICPSLYSKAGYPAATCMATADWVALNVLAPESKLHCTYEMEAGKVATAAKDNPKGFVFTSPAANWFYILAICGKSTTNSPMYFMSSVDATIQKKNEGN